MIPFIYQQGLSSVSTGASWHVANVHVLVWQPIEDCLLPLSVFQIVPAAMEGCCCWYLPLLVDNSTIPPMLKKHWVEGADLVSRHTHGQPSSVPAGFCVTWAIAMKALYEFAEALSSSSWTCGVVSACQRPVQGKVFSQVVGT